MAAGGSDKDASELFLSPDLNSCLLFQATITMTTNTATWI